VKLPGTTSESFALSSGCRYECVMICVNLRSFGCVMRGLFQMSVSRMRVMRGRFVVIFFVVSGCFAMMLRRTVVVVRSLVMMFCR
jgi:hypothetical protein